MRARILLRVDDRIERNLFDSLLDDYDIIFSSSTEDFLHKLSVKTDISILILDISDDSVYVSEILRNLRARYTEKEYSLIVITDMNDTENEAEALKLGADDYIRRPLTQVCLKARIELNLKLNEKRKTEFVINEQKMMMDAIFYQAPVGIAISHSSEELDVNDSSLVSINPEFEKITCRTREELVKTGWGRITHLDDINDDMLRFKKLESGEIKSYSMEKRYIRPDGSVVWVDMAVSSLNLLNDHKYNHICVVQDITDRKNAESALMESERSKSVLLSHLPGLAYRCNYDKEWTMQFVSAGCFDLTGYKSESLLYNRDISFNDLIVPEYRETLRKEWKRILRDRNSFNHEYEIITSSGERKWVLEMGEGVFNNGKVVALEGIIIDITRRKNIENNLKYNSEHDRLTGLYNRNYLEELLKREKDRTIDFRRALIGINVNDIQLLNSVYGFHYIQDILKDIASRLSEYSDESRLLFNISESQFVFYLRKYEDRGELIHFTKSVSAVVESVLSLERIGGGIGIVEIERKNYHDTDQLLKNLLIASEKAMSLYDKEFGFCFFDKAMEIQIIREKIIKRDLLVASLDENDGGLFIEFQPILDLRTNRINAFEALARLRSKKLGQVSPVEFIPVAEKTKLILPVGNKVIQRSLEFLRTIEEHGYSDVSVSINISAVQLLKNDFVSRLIDTVSEMQANSNNITLEITESIFALNYQEINDILLKIREKGIKIAIDDFGTGYSSLARERELNVDCMKIDKFFIDELSSMDEGRFITGDIISMAHKLGHYAVAEGVETEKQKKYLEENGCDKIQGYLISRPLDIIKAIEFLGITNK